MLPTYTDLAIQTDILPTQNIGLLDQSQPQIYSLLADSNNPIQMKQPRRKRTTKLDETMPVMVNPQITRTAGVTFVAPHHHSTIPPKAMPSFVSTHFRNGHTVPFRVYLDHESYGANNINNNQIQSLSMPLNPSLPIQARQTPTWFNGSLPAVHTNSMPQLVTKPQFLGFNRFLNNNINERTVSAPSSQQNGYKHLDSSLTSIDQGSLLSPSHSLSSPLSSISTSDVPSVKPKRKYCKRPRPSAPVEQQHSSQQTFPCPPIVTQPIVSNGLPSIIPASVTVTPPKSEEHPLSTDIPTALNFVPLSPPASINSPPTNIINDSSLIPVQQHLAPHTTTNSADINLISKQYFPDEGFSHIQKSVNDSFKNNLSYNLHRFLAAVYAQYGMLPANLMPTNILPMTCSSSLPGTVANTPSVAIPAGVKKERKRREKGVRKSKVIQKLTVERLRDEPSLTSKSSSTDISAIKKRKHKKLNMKDIRTKKQLRRVTRQTRLAVLKFMMRKRKQQKQQQISTPQLSEVKAEQVMPKLVSTHKAKPDKMETNLPDIIASSLKISFDATQTVESISLYYHRRCKSDVTNENSPKSSATADNRLGLLIEAVEFIETLNGSLKLAEPSNK